MSKRAKKGKKKAADISAESAFTRGRTVPLLSNDKLLAFNLEALKRELLGPFLFGQSTLCPDSVAKFRKEGVLGAEETCLPVFFPRERWECVRRIVTAVYAALALFESKDILSVTMFIDGSAEERLHTLKIATKGQLSDHSANLLNSMFGCIGCHVGEFIERATSGDNVSDSPTMSDKEKLIGPVKDRGNTNFRQERFKAAIGDYTTAIKLCPYNSVLYCNRALCYLKNDEYLCAALDSYRALVLQPGWEKAYYRCAEAWTRLGEHEIAFVINAEGTKDCKDHEDLVRQSIEMSPPLAGMTSTTKSSSKEPTKSSTKSSSKEPTKSNSKEPTKSNSKEPTKSSSKEPTKSSSKESTKSSTKEPIKPSAKTSEQKNDSSASDAAALFDDFEVLSCPLLTCSEMSCSYLRVLGERVQLRTYQPSAYFSSGYNWEKLEPKSEPLAMPTTDVNAIKEPMEAKFDPIWCPIPGEIVKYVDGTEL